MSRPREDHFTNTPEDAAAYDRDHFEERPDPPDPSEYADLEEECS